MTITGALSEIKAPDNPDKEFWKLVVLIREDFASELPPYQVMTSRILIYGFSKVRRNLLGHDWANLKGYPFFTFKHLSPGDNKKSDRHGFCI